MLASIADFRKEALGEYHTDTLIAMSDLAELLMQKRPDEAEELLLHVTQAPKTNPENNPDLVVLGYYALAALLRLQERLDEAQVVDVQAFEACQNTPRIANRTLERQTVSLALTYEAKGDWKLAKSTLEMYLETNVEPQQHVTGILETRAHLARICQRRALWDEAEKVLTQTLGIFLPFWGLTCLDLYKTKDSLAQTYYHLNRLDKAEALLEDVLKDRERHLGRGKEHPETLLNMEHLAFLYRDQGKLEQVEKTLVELVARCQNQPGMYYTRTVIVMAHLNECYMDQKKFAEAKKTAGQMLQERETLDKAATLGAMVFLWKALSALEKYDECDRVM